jgi:hypothetical protein
MTAPVTQCFSLIRGKVMRVTRLDACGKPAPGPLSQVTTKGFISVALTAQTDTGTTIDVTNANGDRCVHDVPAVKFLGYNVVITLCEVDPTLVNLVTNQEVVDDHTGNPVGFRMNSQVAQDGYGYAIELWSDVPGAVCSTGGGGKQYGYTLLPFLQGGYFGDFTVDNAALSTILTGATTKDGNGWGAGPYNVVTGTSGAGPLLDPMDPDDHLNLQLTDVAPPAASCGAGPLGTAATGATAGTPGTWTPANSYGPQTLATMTGITASPTTAWTTGQSMTLGDGSSAHWSGTAWLVGKAP